MRTSRLLLFLAAIVFLLSSAPVFAQSYTEGFDDISTLTGNGWFLQNNSAPVGIASWFQGTPTSAGGPFNSFNGAANSYIAVNFASTSGGTGTISNWLVTPNRTLRNGDVFSFYTRIPTTPPPPLFEFPDRLEVRLSTNGASVNVGAGATAVGDFTTTLLTINPTLVTGVYPQVWTQFTITLGGLPAPTSGRIAFRYFVTSAGPSGSNSDYIGIDQVEYTSYSCPTLTISPPGGPLPAATVDVPYSQTFGQTGALGAPAFAVMAGSPPPPLTLSASGVLSGTPTGPFGNWNFTVIASDASGCSGAQSYSILLNPGAASVVLGNLNPTYDATPQAVTVTTVPAGLTTVVTYAGGPTIPTNAGSYAVVATVNDANYAGSASDTLVIDPRPITVTADPQSKVVGTTDPPLTHQLTSGTLAGSDAITGALSRTPGETPGAYSILQNTVTAGSNYLLTYVGASLTIDQTATTTVMSASPSPANLGASVQLTGTVAASSPSITIPTGAVTFTDGSTTLCSAPLDGAGIGSCNFTAATPLGVHNLTATYGGDTNCTGSAGGFALTVAGATPAFTSPTIAPFTVSLPGSFTITTTGIPAPSLLITGGTLPAGLNFTDNGDGTATLSGTPSLSAFGNHTLTITASNAVGEVDQVITIAIEGSIMQIPTLDVWGLLLFVAALSVVAMFVMRRKVA